MYMKKISVKEIALMSILTAILFILEQILSYVPFVQLSFLLMVLYSKKLGIIKSSIIISIHVFLDHLVSGYFNIIYVIFALIGLLFIPLLINTVFRKVNNVILISLLGVLFSFIYSWINIIPSCFIYEMNLKEYVLADIPFELILGASSFITILVLYKPLEKVFDRVYI